MNQNKKKEKIKPLIETKNLTVTYNLGKSNELTALKEANIKIYPGEYIIIYGPSGCGKSTLLFAIAGLQDPTKGEVIVEGVNITALKKDSDQLVKFHRKKIGIIFQAFHLVSSLNVEKNICLPQIFAGTNKKERNQKVEKLLKRFGIYSQAKKFPNQLSGGQKQRVAIARALVNDPKILLADEPVGNLDSQSAENVLNILKTLNKEEKRTIILVTHDARHLSFANRVFHMKDGVIIKETVNEDIRPEEVKILAKKESSKISKVSKELELLMRTYSGLSASQLGTMLIPFKAKQLVQDVLLEMTTEQIKNIEKTIEEYLMNIHTNDYEMIEQSLDESLERGGAGLDKRTAKKLARKIVSIVEEVKYLKTTEKKAEKYTTSISPEKIQHLRRFILDKHDINIPNELSLKRIDKLLEMRANNQIDSFKLKTGLDLPLERGGAGLDRRNAKKITKEMELIMLLKYS